MASAQAMGGEVIGGAFENSTKLLIIHSYLQPNKRYNNVSATKPFCVDELLLISGRGLLEALSDNQPKETKTRTDQQLRVITCKYALRSCLFNDVQSALHETSGLNLR